MKWIVAGSRTFDDYKLLSDELDKVNNLFGISEIVSGTARGADSLGEKFAKDHNLPCELHPADWDKHGKAAGPIRNAEMAEVSDALIAFWDGQSRGTKSMIDLAKRKGLQVAIVRYDL